MTGQTAQTNPIPEFLTGRILTPRNPPSNQHQNLSTQVSQEKFELFDDLFHTMLKMQPEMTGAIKINHFHAHLRKDALQTFRNISATNKKTLDDVLIVVRRNYVKPESKAKAKHKWHKFTFDANTKSLPDFLEELNECAESYMIDSLLYAKLPPHLKRRS